MFFSIITSGYIFSAEQPAPEKGMAKLQKELDKINKERLALKEENNKLRTERAKVLEELGIAYTKAGLFDEAIDAYTKSLSYGPNNAQIHYYLGLLYQKNRKDTEKAVFHFKKYLYLNPDAKNRQEVRYLIEMILNKR